MEFHIDYLQYTSQLTALNNRHNEYSDAKIFIHT